MSWSSLCVRTQQQSLPPLRVEKRKWTSGQIQPLKVSPFSQNSFVLGSAIMSSFENLHVSLLSTRQPGCKLTHPWGHLPCSPNSISAALRLVDVTQHQLSCFGSHTVRSDYNVSNDLPLSISRRSQSRFRNQRLAFSPLFSTMPAPVSVSKYSWTRFPR